MTTKNVLQQSADWYAGQTVLPVKPKNFGVKNFTKSNHAKWFLSLLELGNYLPNFLDWKVSIDQAKIHCTYRHRGGVWWFHHRYCF